MEQAKNNYDGFNVQNDKATWTALIISPPQEKWGKIQEIRKEHDKAYSRWMPHINIVFPFVKPENFQKFSDVFQEDFQQNLKKFKISLKNFRNFNHGRNSVLYLEPEITEGDKDSIKNILFTVLQKRSDLDDQNKKSDKGYTPHLTVGTFPSNKVENVAKGYQQNWEPIEFEVEEVQLIQRQGKDNPFYVSKTIKLGDNN